MFCHQCGNKAVEKAKFCSSCGIKLVQPDSKSSLEKTNTVNNLNVKVKPKTDALLNQQIRLRESLEKAFTEENWTRISIEELKKITDTEQLTQLRNFLLSYEKKEKPLHRAVWGSKYNLAKLLLDFGFDPYKLNKDRHDVFDLSAGDPKIRLLLSGYKAPDMLKKYIKFDERYERYERTHRNLGTSTNASEIRNKSNKTENYKYNPLVQEDTSNLPSSLKLTVMEVLFSFKGRISRSTFWIYALLSYFGFAAISIPFILYASKDYSLLFIAFIPLYIWLSLAISVKRWHDRNKSGWFVLINCIPYLGWLWTFIENGLLAGDVSHNEYGPPEK